MVIAERVIFLGSTGVVPHMLTIRKSPIRPPGGFSTNTGGDRLEMSITPEDAKRILGYGAQGNYTTGGELKEACLMGQRAINVLEVIRNKASEPLAIDRLLMLRLLGVSQLIDDALGKGAKP